ncbi:MAG: hypothetical protein LQ343_000066 [Gyalolechia ehrenbergii]|nr:MAG: hypothetical protein LQ343_000066 [Gyalolechia ehrenbergii]
MLGSFIFMVLSLAALIPTLLASPLNTLEKRTASALLAIVPKANTCEGAPFPQECKTADEAAPFINESFRTYAIESPGEAAAVIAIMAFESGDFKYNVNHFPGTPGQGTRNMQSPQFNLKYAQSIPGLKDKLATAGSDPKAVLALLTANGEYDFGSGAWFLTTQCSDTVRAGLKSGSLVGWQAYITECIQTTATPERLAYWQRAANAMTVPGN